MRYESLHGDILQNSFSPQIMSLLQVRDNLWYLNLSRLFSVLILLLIYMFCLDVKLVAPSVSCLLWTLSWIFSTCSHSMRYSGSWPCIHLQMQPCVGFPVSRRQDQVYVCVCVCACVGGRVGLLWGGGGGLRAEERRRGSVGGGDIKDKGKSDPLVRTKQAVGFRDKGNAIHRVTVNATHASPVWLHSAFPSFNFIMPQCHNKHCDPTETVLLILNSRLRFVFRMFCKFQSDVLLCGYVCLGSLGQELCF